LHLDDLIEHSNGT